jgi:hypothetical protein
MPVSKKEVLEKHAKLMPIKVQFRNWEALIDEELVDKYVKLGRVFIPFSGLPQLTSDVTVLNQARELVIERYTEKGWNVKIGKMPMEGDGFFIS